MKKYSILTLSLVFAGVVCYAQQGIAVSSAANKNSEPTINGIPYSQYKAQQDALKLQQEVSKPVDNNSNLIPIQSGAIRPTATPVNNSIQQKPDRQPAVNTNSTPVISAKPAEKIVNVPVPATQMIPAGTLKSSVPMQAPVTTTAVKHAEVNSNATEGKLVAIPTLTLATNTEAAPVVATPVVAAQQVQGQAKPAEVVVTPPSVINASKAPVKQN